MSDIKLNTIPEAIEDLKNGKVIIVVDDENRENEGDFLSAAELTTPEIINFMTIHGRGLICTPLPEKRCDELGLEAMVSRSTDPKETAFTVSIDLLGDGVSTGISASDRAKTILALMDENTKPTAFMRPGHIFPLRAKTGGVLKRAGHTEAAIDLTKLAGLKEGGVICEIMNEDGTMARLPELVELAKKLDYTESYVSQLMSGVKKVNVSFINKFEKKFNVEIDFKIKLIEENFKILNSIENQMINLINLNIITINNNSSSFAFNAKSTDFFDYEDAEYVNVEYGN